MSPPVPQVVTTTIGSDDDVITQVGGGPLKKGGAGRVSYPTCFKTFHTLLHLQRHVRSVHSKHTCINCESEFGSRAELANHKNCCKMPGLVTDYEIDNSFFNVVDAALSDTSFTL